MSARTYAIIFIFIIAFVVPTIIIELTPYGDLPEDDERYWMMATIVYLINTSLLILVWRNNSTSELTFWKGLCLICSQMMSGWANATIVYIFPILFIAYLVMVLNTITGLFKGREYTQMKWLKLVDWF